MQNNWNSDIFEKLRPPHPWVFKIPKLKLGIFVCFFNPPTPLWEFFPNFPVFFLVMAPLSSSDCFAKTLYLWLYLKIGLDINLILLNSSILRGGILILKKPNFRTMSQLGFLTPSYRHRKRVFQGIFILKMGILSVFLFLF